VDVRFVGPEGVHEADEPALEALLARDDGIVWVDVPVLDDAAETLLRDRLHAHPAVIDACRRRNHVPSVHAYADMYFTILHAPQLGEAGHVHLLELDQLVGRRFLATVHGPINPALDVEDSLAETRAVLRRITEGRFHPASPAQLSYALGSAVVRRQRELISEVAERLPSIEQQVMAPTPTSSTGCARSATGRPSSCTASSSSTRPGSTRR
jgi:Mg2+ and Co2+ transporter CorA